ncbi:hypothetical protein Taro_012631 [Colocasia esculenta]|uniref:Uncharacterized protein n=1 Tax=Colocasia esculenta TaxID=4460 RepID=A0A843U4G0_COLES|nr:hypothetical protein [Colocasia esculenta]
MKASLKLRDEQKPLLKAKIPVCILGLPFLSGMSAGDTRELRLDLATAFESGPSVRVSYRPNDPWNPFTLSVKTGSGTYGSPGGSAAMTMSAEFSLVGRGVPRFTIQIKPRFGDFCIRKSTSSTVASPTPFTLVETVVVDHGANGEGSVAGVGFRAENGIFAGKKPNGISTVVPAAAPGGVGGLLSGSEITARSSMPLGNRAAVRFRWGVRIPPELRSGFLEQCGCTDPIGGLSLPKLPLLVMSKVSLEHVAGEAGPREKKLPDAAEACLAVQRQLAALQTEHGMLRKAVEELRAGLVTPCADTAGKGSRSEARAPKAWEGDRNQAKASAFEKNGGRSVGRKTSEAGGTAAKDDVSEELRKALMGAGGGS